MPTNPTEPTEAQKAAKAAEQQEAEQKQAIDAAVAEALETQRKAYEAQQQSTGDSSQLTPDQGDDDRREYVLEADHGHEITSAPGKPMTYRDLVKGDRFKLDPVRAAELIASGAVSDPSVEDDDEDEPGAQTEAPRERRTRRRSTT